MTIFAKPRSTLSWVSFSRHSAATGSSAVGCAPYAKAARSWSIVQSGPQSTGQPLAAYF